MKIKKLFWFGLRLLLVLVGALTVASPIVPHAVAGGHIQKHPAAVTVAPSLSADQATINVIVNYTAEFRTRYGRNGHKDFGFKKIRVIEVLINGVPRKTQRIEASAGGNIAVAIPANSLPAAELAKPVTVQAKTYTKLTGRGKPKHLAAASKVVTLDVSPAVAWAPASLDITGLAGTTTRTTLEVTPGSLIGTPHFSVSSAASSMATLDTGGETKLEAKIAYMLSLTVDLPLDKPAGIYRGTIELRDGGRLVGQLPLTITVAAATSQAIPRALSSPSTDRIVVDEGDYMVKDQLDIGLADTTPDPDQRIRQIAADNHGVIVGSIPETHVYQLRFQVGNPAELAQLRGTLVALPDVSFVSRNFFATSEAESLTPPNDPLSGAWDEDHPDGTNWGLEYIKALTAWRTTTGDAAVRIGVIDNGFDVRHEDLKDNAVAKAGFKDRTIDDKWHGNAVAGVICATGNNGKGIAGVNWRCSLNMYAPALQYIPGDTPSTLRAIDHISAAMQQSARDDMRVVNISIGYVPQGCRELPVSAECPQKLNESNDLFKSSINWAKQNGKDVLWVFSAGNEKVDVKYQSPADLAALVPDNVITVAAINKDGTKWSDSSFGQGVTVAAPGMGIVTTYSAFNYPPGTCHSKFCSEVYMDVAGTSVAAPFVSGLAGLVIAAHNSFNAAKIKQCIVDAAAARAKVPGHSFSPIDAPGAVACQPKQPACVFAVPAIYRCESDDPTVTLQSTTLGDSTACTFSARVDWGDGVIQNFSFPGTAAGPVLSTTHRYAAPGSYQLIADINRVSGPGGVNCLILSRVHLFELHGPGNP